MEKSEGIIDKALNAYFAIEELRRMGVPAGKYDSYVRNIDYTKYINIEDLINWYYKNIDGYVGSIRANGESIYKNGKVRKIVCMDDEDQTVEYVRSLQASLDSALEKNKEYEKKISDIQAKINTYSCVYNQSFPHDSLVIVSKNLFKGKVCLQLDDIVADFNSLLKDNKDDKED